MDVKKTTVWREIGDGDRLTTGNVTRHISEIVLYDENGPIITNYTNCSGFEFETNRPISTRALKAPNWENENGFIIREYDSWDARYGNGNAWYVLFIHIGNVPQYASEMVTYWENYHDAGAVKCEFSLEGCKFCRIVGNTRVKAAQEGINEVFEQYKDAGASIFNNYFTVCHNPGEAISAYKHLISMVEYYQATVEDIKDNYGILELIQENGADGPINHNDYNDVSRRYKFLANTYRI